MMMQRHKNIKAKIKKATQYVGLAVIMVSITLASTPLQAQRGAPTIIRDTEIENTLSTWITPLLKSSGIGNDGVNLVLVQSTQLNAFVAGGANMFLYTGLIEETENPGELVGVMAHELGHIAGGHLIAARTAMERASYESILGIVLGIGAALATGDGRAANAVIAGGNNIATRNFLSHSRVKEASADQAAFTYMTRAGLNPSGLSSFFEKLEDQELLPSTQQSEYVRTHPITRTRIDAMDALVGKSDLQNKTYPAAWVEAHTRMKAKLIGFISPEQVAWKYDDSDTSIAAEYARSIAAYRLNDIPTAIRKIDALIAKEPKNPYFQELKGQMLVDFSRVNEALPYYRKAVNIMPDAPLFRIALAHALIETGNDPSRLQEAVNHLQRAERKENRSRRLHRLLATAYGRLGQESLAKLHLAEEAVLQGRLPYAKAQAEGALKGFKTGSAEWLKTKDVLTHIANLETAQNR